MTETDATRPAYRNRVKGLENSISTFVLYAIMKPGTFKFTNRNYYYFDEPDVWQGVHYTNENWPYMYALFEEVPEKQNQFTEAITVMTYIRFEEVEKWKDTINTTLEENLRDEA